MLDNNQFTRSIQLSSSLHFDKLSGYRAAGNGVPILMGQTAVGIDNGYGLQGNPTLHELQNSISMLEKGKHSLLYPSGSTALNALEVFLNQGDHWLMPDSVYFPVQRFADYLNQHYDITYDLYNPSDSGTIAKLINDKTKLIHIETPSSVTFDITDVDAVVEIAKSHNIITSADNTWASGILFKPLEHAVDISILSLTKYVAGYSDVFMGSITTPDSEIYEKLAYHHRVYGYTVSPFSTMLVNRGLESLQVRLVAEANNALKLINTLEGHSKIVKIYYVDANTAKDLSGSNSLFSVELDRVYSDDELEKLFSVLSTFKIGESWGGTRSLVLPFQPDAFSGRFNPPKNTILRFHSGLENIDLQRKDIKELFNILDSFS